jgi:Domain of unknown function (DUF4145)
MTGDEERGLFTLWPSEGEIVPDDCPNCRRSVALVFLWAERLWPTRNAGDWKAIEGTDSLVEYVWGCSYCLKTTVVWAFFDDGEDAHRQPTEMRIVWPERAPRELPPEAPEALRSLYREASVCEHAGALRGAAVLYRASAEELVKDRGAGGKNLWEKIEGLGNQGVSADIVRDLHEARLLGNDSIHEGLSYDAREVADVAVLIADAVDELYVEPAKREAMRLAREARRTGATVQPDSPNTAAT